MFKFALFVKQSCSKIRFLALSIFTVRWLELIIEIGILELDFLCLRWIWNANWCVIGIVIHSKCESDAVARKTFQHYFSWSKYEKSSWKYHTRIT